jgi:UDP-N-acetylmuramoyl-tripeptide--D-alanyl-D-alanine ligase
MTMLTLNDVFEALTGQRLQGADLVLTEAQIDSRQVIPGSLFIALPGERVDGHTYVGDAFHKGAHAALIQQDLSELFPVVDVRAGKTLPASLPKAPFCVLVDDCVLALQQIARFWRTKLNLRVVGITGSVGKSTTKELVAEVLSTRSRTLKNPGNLNNEIGLPLTLLRLGDGYEHAVLEMGFYVPGEISLLCSIARPQVGVVTNIGSVHAERAGSKEEIARGKSELVQALPADGFAILNYDDPYVRPMAEKTNARVLFYGLDPKADLWADEIVSDGLEGIRFNLHYRQEVLQLRVPLIGRHSVHTVLRAVAVGVAEGLSFSEIVYGLKNSRAQLRLVAVYTSSGAMLLDDSYNASPESTLAALNLLEDLDGRKIAVLGDMLELGPYEEEGHQKVGIRAAEVAAELVTIGERGLMIADSAHKAGLSSRHIHSFKTIEEVVEHLKPNLGKGDVVLVKGSHGMRMDRITAALEAEQ